MHTDQRGPDAERSAERSDDLDVTYLKDLGGFILRAARRRRRLALSVFLVGVVASLGAAVLAPRVYHVETKILAQQNLVMPVLVNPNRAVSSQADAPTRAVREMILTRASLLAIIKETSLVSEWAAHRSPIMKLKDRVVSALSRAPSDEDRSRALVEMLEKKLSVSAEGMTITIGIDWDNAELALAIVRSAQGGFLTRRSELEVAVISDTLEILDEQSKRQGAVLASTLADVQKLWRGGGRGGGAPSPPPPSRSAGPAPARPEHAQPTVLPPPPPVDIERLLAETRSSIKEKDESRRRWLGQLNAKLQEAQVSNGPAHPSIIALQGQIRDASVESPEVAMLRRKEQGLLEQIKRGAAADLSDQGTGAFMPVPVGALGLGSAGEPPKGDESPELEIARAKLLSTARKYQDLGDRMDSAQIELYTARAAFKYRYDVAVPPEIPKEPSKPSVPMLVFGGLLLSLALSVFAAAARDMAEGRFIEAWQVRRRLKIPLLAEVRRP